jgi:N-acetylglucosamine kinase-like BadF-type ATPase
MRDFDRLQTNSPLGAKILRESGAQTWFEFQSRATAIPDDVFPRIFSVVAAAAENGDSKARQFLQEAARELAGLVRDLVERLQFRTQEFSLIKSGGMVGRSMYFDQHIDECLRQVALNAKFTDLALPPAEAAARIALKLLPALGGAGK